MSVEDIGRMLIRFATVLLFGWLLGALMGWPIKLMVNYIFAPGFIVSVFGVPQITFWQAFWLSWLCTILFKGSTSK